MGAGGPLDCARQLVAAEGVRVFGRCARNPLPACQKACQDRQFTWRLGVRGWLPFFCRMAPIFTVQMTLYEQFRKMLGLDYMN